MTAISAEIAPPAGSPAAARPVSARPPRSRAALRRILRLPPVVGAGAAYLLSALVVFREGLGGPGQFPQGTNALNSYLYFWFVQHHPWAVWLYPFTDWGQPVPGFTGVTVLTPVVLLVDPGVVVRLVEFASWVGAGLAMYTTIRRLNGTALAAFLGGFYYLALAQTPQLFEGHVATMISLALGPLFLYSVYRLFDTPSARAGAAAAVLLYLEVSLGDLGMVYFLVLFGILLAVYLSLRRGRRAAILRAPLRVLASLGIFLVLMLPWLYPYALGIRPEYTTTITTTSLPFQSTTGENLGLAFSGYVQDNSFVHFSYGHFSYGLGDLALLPLYFLVPLLLLVYVALARNRDRWALYGAAVLAMVFSTGHLFPVLSAFNGWVYDHVPFFDAIPAVFRWSEITILAYGVLLGLFVTDLERGTRPAPGHLRATVRRWLRRPEPVRPAAGVSSARLVRVGARLRARLRRRDALTAVAVAIVSLTLLQTFEVVAQPPGLFEYPAAYTEGFSVIRAQPLYGGVLGIPYSGIYERSPWAGVTESSLFMTPYFTGGDAEIFEAGTPYSLALDQFVGDGLTLGYSRNLTKFLGGLNVEYVVATRYSNWSYINSFAYAPRLSYYALQNQTGLGPAIATEGYQSIYRVPAFVGNLSFHPRYFLYYGPPSLLYQVLDQPWYAGPGDVLVDGASVGAGAAEFVRHAAGLVTTPALLGTVPPDVLAAAEGAAVPVQVIAEANDASGTNASQQFDPWNASGGQVVTVNASVGSLVDNLSAAPLYAAGYRTISVSARISPPPGTAYLEAQYAASSVREPVAAAVETAHLPLPYGVPGFAETVTTVDNVTQPPANTSTYTSHGVDELRWNFTPGANVSQYLQMNVTNLTGWNGLSLDLEGNPQIPLVWRIVGNSTALDVPGYATFVPIQGNLTHVSFYLPPSGYAPGAGPMTPPGPIAGIQLAVPRSANASQLVLSNLTLFSSPAASYRDAYVGTFRLAETGNLTVSAPTGTRINSITISTGLVNTSAPSPFESDRAPLPTPTRLNYAPRSTGWGVVLLAQTFNPAWSLTGAGPSLHAAGNVGLNAWLVNLTGAETLHVAYRGDALVAQAYSLEAALGGVAVLVAGVVYRGRRRRSAAEGRP